MANIQPYIDQIQNATYGEEVRSSIINALELVNADNESYQEIKEAVVDAKDTVEEVAENISDQISTADGLATTLEGDISVGQQVKSELEDSTTTAQQTKGDLDSSITAGTTLQSDLEDLVASGSSIRADVEASAQTATQKATEASQSASTAVQAKNETVIAKDTAVEASQTAVTKAGEASTSASTATQKAGEANQSAQTAVQAKDTAVTKATEAGQSAQSASQSAQTATQKAQEALQSAQSVSDSATQIQTNKNDISAIKADFSELVPVSNRLAPYLYKENTYIRNGVENALYGYDLFKIPVNYGDVVLVSQNGGDAVWWGALGITYVFSTLDESVIYNAIAANTEVGTYTATGRYGIFKIPEGITHLMVSAKRDYAEYVRIAVNTPLIAVNTDCVSLYNTVIEINDSTALKSKAYMQAAGHSTPQRLTELSGDYYSLTLKIKSGDTIVCSGLVTGINWYFTYVDDAGELTMVMTDTFTAPADGMINVFAHPNYPRTVILFPKDAIKIDYKNIANAPNENRYSGLEGVAFGTSLTYRAQTTYGYLQYLPDLSGVTFDNQGIGSSTILGNMLTAIKNYTGYAGKRVAILEGFVNDWYTNKDLGTYEDTGETTVCGCVRSAINYMLSQNANLTIFLVLDPYGRNYGGVNCATTATNGAGLTQKEYYDEIAKVGESLGIPVIKEYAISQISENTPQYIVDNIHPTALGAKQSANVIWSQMRQYYPNQI